MKRRKIQPQNSGVEEIFTASMAKRRSQSERWADWMTTSFGTIVFFNLNLLFFVVWIVWNIDLIPGLVPFDSYPFGMLTMIVSLEAIVLSTIVLISQNRATKIEDLREEIDLQVNVRSEKQISEVLKILKKIEYKLRMISSHSRELTDLEKPMDLKTLEKRITRRIK